MTAADRRGRHRHRRPTGVPRRRPRRRRRAPPPAAVAVGACWPSCSPPARRRRGLALQRRPHAVLRRARARQPHRGSRPRGRVGVRLEDRRCATERKDGTTPGQVIETDPAAGESLEGGRHARAPRVPRQHAGRPPARTSSASRSRRPRPRSTEAGEFVVVVTEQADEEVGGRHRAGARPRRARRAGQGQRGAARRVEGPQPRTVPEGLSGGTYEQAAAALAGGAARRRSGSRSSTTRSPPARSSAPGPGPAAEVPRDGDGRGRRVQGPRPREGADRLRA